MTWVDLEEVREFHLPLRLLELTQQSLWDFGRKKVEARVLWAGKVDRPGTMKIIDVVTPTQENYFDEVIVEHAEISRINLSWHLAGFIPVGQVHTHPNSAWHSEEDDAYPITTQRGSLSLVIPNFAREKRSNLDECALFRLADTWREVTPLISILRIVGE